jgi:hypothetical protein
MTAPTPVPIAAFHVGPAPETPAAHAVLVVVRGIHVLVVAVQAIHVLVPVNKICFEWIGRLYSLPTRRL